MRSRRKNGPLKIVFFVIAVFVALVFTYFHDGHGSGTKEAPQKSGNYSVTDLPKEARQTLALTDRGGPYPYPQDDGIFGNRERLLPTEPAGYYREFTVATPGSDDRGARRIIRGQKGEIYYTSNHYASFHLVERN